MYQTITNEGSKRAVADIVLNGDRIATNNRVATTQFTDENHPPWVASIGLDEETKRLLNTYGVVVEGSTDRLSPLPFQTGNGHSAVPVVDTPPLGVQIDPADAESTRGERPSSDRSTRSVPATDVKTSSQSRLVGIPAYNEGVSIGSTVTLAQRYADEVVVIDDGSSDDTADIAAQNGATVLGFETNQGKGRALRRFFDYARTTSYDSFIVLDGDGQHLPTDIPDVVAPIENGDAEMVIGSRYLDETAVNETPFYRRIGQKFLDAITLGSSGHELTDTQSGFRAFSATAPELLSIRTDGIGVESEMTRTAIDSGLTIEEVPISVRYHGLQGQTYNPVHHGVIVVRALLEFVENRHPLLFFGFPGLLFLVVGIAIGLFTLSASGDYVSLWQLFVSVFLTLIGVLAIFCGLVLNRISNMIDEPGRMIV